MSCIGFARDVEVLVRVLGKLLEEESEQGVHVFTGSDGVGDRGAGVGEAGVDWLVEENDAGVGVPAVGIWDDFEVFVDGGGTEFEEQAG